jgi:hypothetical protein
MVMTLAAEDRFISPARETRPGQYPPQRDALVDCFTRSGTISTPAPRAKAPPPESRCGHRLNPGRRVGDDSFSISSVTLSGVMTRGTSVSR